jgi:hypothetical protein
VERLVPLLVRRLGRRWVQEGLPWEVGAVEE